MCEWIAVSEQLPEPKEDDNDFSEDVLVYLEDSLILMCVCFYNHKKQCWHYDVVDDPLFDYPYIGEFPYPELITHWRPLPELPQGRHHG